RTPRYRRPNGFSRRSTSSSSSSRSLRRALDPVISRQSVQRRSANSHVAGRAGQPSSSLRVVEELGRGGRLRGDAAGELVVAAYAAESAHGPRLARGLSLADLAHAVALVEGGDLAGEDARSLLRGLLELHAIPGDEFPWDPSLGDAFNAREAELERRVGR